MPDCTHTLIDSGYACVKKTRYGYMLYNKYDMYIGKSLDLYGEFSYFEAQLFEKLIKPKSIVLDVGANIGAFTILFSKLVGVEGRVLAFEPQRIVHQMLCANVALNSLVNVDAHNCCVSSVRAEVNMIELNQYAINNFGGISLDLKGQNSSKIDAIPIDELALEGCHFMKVDVEGMESEVLSGAQKTIQKYQPIMYLENDRVEKSTSLIQRVKDFGYRIYEHTPPLYCSKNFFGCDVNVFGNIVSKNILCIPSDSNLKIDGLKEIV